MDFSRTTNHVAIRLGRGDYPNLHSEKFIDDWLVPVASPDLIKQYGMIERGTNLSKYPLLESGDEPWNVWSQADEEAAWLSRAPSIDDSAGLLAAAEEGLGYALARWTLVARALQKGTLRLAGYGALPYGFGILLRVSEKLPDDCPRWRSFANGLSPLRAFPGPGAADSQKRDATVCGNP